MTRGINENNISVISVSEGVKRMRLYRRRLALWLVAWLKWPCGGCRRNVAAISKYSAPKALSNQKRGVKKNRGEIGGGVAAAIRRKPGGGALRKKISSKHHQWRKKAQWRGGGAIWRRQRRIKRSRCNLENINNGIWRRKQAEKKKKA
jgi:hypothetical protein